MVGTGTRHYHRDLRDSRTWSAEYLERHRAAGNESRAEARASPYLFIVFNMVSDTGSGVVATRHTPTALKDLG